MGRPARKAKSQAASKLAEALNFVSEAAGGSDGIPWHEHARIGGRWIIVTDGVLTAGHPIEEDLTVCPHIARLIDAINKAGDTLSIADQGNGRLLISGAKLKATVPCIAGEDIPPVMPDPQCAVLNDRLKVGFAAVCALAKNEADRIIEASLLLRANSVFSTNGQVIFEFWHGIDLPPGMTIPKASAAAVARQTKPLTGFGFSHSSATFYFEDGSWFKTQLYANEWPNVDELFNVTSYPVDVPPDLWDAVKAIENFSADGGVHFHADKLKTTYDNYGGREGPIYGASYDVPGLQGLHSFSARLLKVIEPACKQMDYTTNVDRALFIGDDIRGVIMKRMSPEPAPDRPSIASYQALPADATGEDVANAFAGVQEAATGDQAGTWGQPSLADPNAQAWTKLGWGGNRSFDPDIDDDVPF